jgi:Zn-dependent M32 family carboxypeptidase
MPQAAASFPDDLVRRASGRDLGSGDFLAHLRRRYLGEG